MHCLDESLEIKVTTTDATPTTVAQVQLSENETCTINVKLFARDTDLNIKSWCLMFVSKRIGSSSPITIVGLCNEHGTAGDDVPWSVNIIDNAYLGTAPLIQITGAADTTIHWLGRVSYEKFSTE